MKHPIVYDLNLNTAAILENATKIGYTQKANNLHTANFTLPADDPKNAECQHFRFVEIFDGDDRVDLFRIVPTKKRKTGGEKTVTYQLEHVLATLIDKTLFRYHQIGNIGVYTSEVLEYILSHQETKHWKLGRVDFDRQFEYKWENENLLAALFSVPKPFIEPYLFTWDTTTYPWTLNLIRPSDEVAAYVRYGKNLRGITKDSDPTQLCTRLNCLGYGEGVNQLGIESVNPTGKPYIEADTISKYGPIERTFVDRRYESAQSLFEAGKAMLEGIKEPRVSYQIDTADIRRAINKGIIEGGFDEALQKITTTSLDKFEVGKVVLIEDEDGEEIRNRIVSVSKSDVNGAPGDIKIEIQNPAADIAQSIADLADRQRINEVYAQGATNLDSHDFADNCDPEHPAVLRLYIPEGTVRINKMQLSFRAEAFRGYTRGMKSAGQVIEEVTSGPSSRETSAAGGGGTSGPSSRTTSTAGGDHRHRVFYYAPGSFTGGELRDYYAYHPSTGSVFLQIMADNDGHLYTEGSSGTHSHGMDHNHTVPDHTHKMDHTHPIEINIPGHTHPLEFGIYEGPEPSKMTVKVDGNTVLTGTSSEDVDIIPYLSKDSDGKIQRGTWHTIEIVPDDLGRIVANVHTQLFVQSRGGGDY